MAAFSDKKHFPIKEEDKESSVIDEEVIT